ncbi:MAG: type IV secretory system conjugative DNA transfer family protein, partial [Dehalococcoidia bacterium]
LLQAHLPSVRYTPIDLAERTSLATEYRLSSGRRLLRIDPANLSQRLLTSLQPLRSGEEIVVQWVITAAGPVVPAHTATAAERSGFSVLRRRVPLSAEEATALRQKQSRPLLLGTGRIGISARGLGRRRALLRQVEATWHSSRAPGAALRRRTLGEQQVAARLRARKTPLLIWPGIFNSEELAGLIGWPIAVEQIPGLILGGCRPLAPSPLLPATGTVIGEATFPGSERPVALEVDGRLRHAHVVGPTGTGKSTLLLRLIEADLSAGHGLVVVDPKGDLVSAVLARVPAYRQRDVIVLDPADEAAAVGLNPLRSAAGARSEVAVENLVGLLKSLYRSSWGPRT